MSYNRFPELDNRHSRRFTTEADHSYSKTKNNDISDLPVESGKKKIHHKKRRISSYRLTYEDMPHKQSNNVGKNKEIQSQMSQQTNNKSVPKGIKTSNYSQGEQIMKIINQLRTKIALQSKEIQSRNQTIYGLKQNFENLSNFAKQTRENEARLKKELEICQMQKNELFQVNKQLRGQFSSSDNKDRYKDKHDGQAHQISELQKIIQTLKQENKSLQMQVIKSISPTKGDSLNMESATLNKLKLSQRQVCKLEETLEKYQIQISSLNKQLESSKIITERYKEQKDVYSKLKQQQDRTLKEQLKNAKMNVELYKKEIESLRETIHKKNIQIRKKKEIIDKLKQNQEGPEKSANKKPSRSIKKSRDTISKETTHRNVSIDDKQREEKEGQKFKDKKGSNKQLGSQNAKKLEQKNIRIKQLVKALEQKLLQTEELKEELEKMSEQKSILEMNSNHQQNQLAMLQAESKQANETIKQLQSQKQQAQITLKRINEEIEKGNKAITKLKNFNKYIEQIQAILDGEDPQMSSNVTILNSANYKELINSKDDLHKQIKSFQNKASQLEKSLENSQETLHKVESDKQQNSSKNLSLQMKVKQLEDQCVKAQFALQQYKSLLEQSQNKLKAYKTESQQQQIDFRKQITANEQTIQSWQIKASKSTMLEGELKVMSERNKKLNDRKQTLQNELEIKKQELEKHISNNQMLWADNKQLKARNNQIIKKYEKKMYDIELERQEEVRAIQKRFADRMEREIQVFNQVLRGQEGSLVELKKMVLQKDSDLKIEVDKHSKAIEQLQFYKNRIKELEKLLQAKDKDIQEKNIQINKLSDIIKKNNAEFKKLSPQRHQKDESFNIQEMSSCQQQLHRKILQIKSQFLCRFCGNFPKKCLRSISYGYLYCQGCQEEYYKERGYEEKLIVDEHSEEMIENLMYTESKSKQLQLQIKRLQKNKN